ncbi:CCR4-NOT transcription complex subunit 4 [Trachymyrmex zeteki]|uniref:CCR4-NOT transcription complex subunit 4 n=2 Tax=Mycetomoellerius zeteki TaxID=64791 RepID=A0A151WHJ0_9HYME|nr:CCR4-NOT transcription complex subunit 4 [Trachymyrmex zeteki]
MSVLNQSGEDAVECPLCMEPLEVDDLNFFPCTCGYQICRFCWHRIRTDENGLCPACRKAYSENPADFKPLTKEEIARLKAEKRLKDQQRKQRVTENRKHLANVRVVQKNLVFVVGLPMRLADADVLKKHEYFGKFGKIHKVVINQSTSYAGSQGPSASAYVTYQRQEDALRAIEAVNNIVVDGRTIKTSLGTTKYCSHFMRNQACPKPDCMYLHDLGDQEASFTKEEMHQGKHQEYERKLVQSLHAHASSVQRKPTPSPPVTGSIVRESGTVNSQTKEAWPSLQPGQTNSTQSSCKEISPPTQTTSQHSNVISGNGTVAQQSHMSSGVSTHQQNNNKDESGVGVRRGKSNSESKAQAARNKHKNSQNKEKHGTRTTSRSESSSINTQNSSQSQITGQKDVRNFSADTNSEMLQKLVNINGAFQNGERRHSDSETDQQREGSTPASTISSTEDSNVNHQAEHLAESSEENSGAVLLGSSPASTNSSQGANQLPPPGLHNGSQMQLNHRSIFQADNNSFFSSNTFQKIPTTTSIPPNSLAGMYKLYIVLHNISNNVLISRNSNSSEKYTEQIRVKGTNTNLDWTSTGVATIPDSLPTVHSSEDWQAAFGFQPESSRTNHIIVKSSSTDSSRVPFNSEGFADEEVYINAPYTAALTEPSSGTFTSNLLVNSSASKFMADYQQNSLQQRLNIQAQQTQENCEYIKQNGHATMEEVRNHCDAGSDVKADDDLGFDPFHETQKALAELLAEDEMQVQQQKMFQQQQQREREEQTRVQHQQTLASLNQQHFPQVAHIAHLQQQAQHLQNLQVLQSHSLLSRLPQNLLPSGAQSPAQGTVTATTLGQRSRLPPPGFPGSTPNHMNSFGLGIPRPAPTNSALSGAQPPQPQNAYLPNGSPLLNTQSIGKCTGDVYTLKDWCEINNQQQQFHHQALHQKGWNNFGPIADWTSIDPAIVTSSRPLPFQTTSAWQFSHIHPSHVVTHNTQQEQNAPTQHWAMQPPPGFAAPSTTGQLNNPQPSTTAQPHTKLISAGSEIETQLKVIFRIIMVEEIQKKLQNEADTLRQIQKEYNKALSQRQQLDGQLNENIMVKKELDILKEENDVFKLIGPVLVKQELCEAKQNVDKRMDYIKSELKRVDDLMSTLDKKLDSQRDVIDKLQQAFQQTQIKGSINQSKS